MDVEFRRKDGCGAGQPWAGLDEDVNPGHLSTAGEQRHSSRTPEGRARQEAVAKGNSPRRSDDETFFAEKT